MESLNRNSPSSRRSVLLIVPLPPPVSGQALACQALLNELKFTYRVEVINYNKSTFVQGINSFGRLLEVGKILIRILNRQRHADVVYLTISQSIAGNIKDLITYLLCFKKLPRMIIHLHGGGIKNIIFDKYPLLQHANRFLLKHIGGAVVLGNSLKNIFTGIISENKIHVVPNFVEQSLFSDRQSIEEKFRSINPIKILFLSNLIPGKGHDELVEAYKILDDSLRKNVQIDFAGGFESEEHKRMFLNKITGIQGIYYHGTVYGIVKERLFSQAHLFCLPTYYPYEGQPISILEAYASGCVVLTTDHGGIRDVFRHELNGFYVKKKSHVSIKKTIEHAIKRVDNLSNIAFYNRRLAEEQFNKKKYISSLMEIIDKVCIANTR